MLIRHSEWTKTALLSIFLTLLAVPAMTQSFYGSLISVVQDAQGGVIPGAPVMLTNTATSERRDGVSGSDGEYRFLNLVPGTYRPEAELAVVPRYPGPAIEV